MYGFETEQNRLGMNSVHGWYEPNCRSLRYLCKSWSKVKSMSFVLGNQWSLEAEEWHEPGRQVNEMNSGYRGGRGCVEDLWGITFPIIGLKAPKAENCRFLKIQEVVSLWSMKVPMLFVCDIKPGSISIKLFIFYNTLRNISIFISTVGNGCSSFVCSENSMQPVSAASCFFVLRMLWIMYFLE